MKTIECHEEQIHTPGYIQSFGYLIGLDAATKKVRFFSDNLFEIFYAQNMREIIGRRLEEFSDVFLRVIWSEGYKNVDYHTRKDSETYIDTIALESGIYYMNVQRTGHTVFLEFEKVTRTTEQRGVIASFANIFNTSTPTEIWKALLTSIENIIDYDRLLVYKFLEDGSGKVIAERNKTDVESWLNLHFPEFDIPRQARAFYLINKKRILSNAFQEAVPLISSEDEPADLTFVQSRALSPVHVQYVKNTGVCSSFSSSIIVDGKLWGLVTCHNFTPKHVDLLDRQRAEILTILAANAYSSYKARIDLQHRLDFGVRTEGLRKKLLEENDLVKSVSANLGEMMNFAEADGIAVVMDKQILTEGSIPEIAKVLEIAEFAKNNAGQGIYRSDRFSKEIKPEADYGERAAGIMCSVLSKPTNLVIIWFRGDYTHTVQWAGLPEKVLFTTKKNGGTEEIVFRPRENFDLFQQQVYGRSRPWTENNKIAAEIIESLIMETSYNDYYRIQKLNEELTLLNEELENFSHTVSHDFNTPLTIMRLNAQMLVNSGTEKLSDKNKAEEIIRQIDEMAAMMTSVLQHSKTRKYDAILENVAVENIIRKIAEDAKATYQSPKTQIEIGTCPGILADATLAYQVFLNVINNAVKYSSKNDAPAVKINGEILEDSVEYRVQDNGIGIAEQDAEKVFKPYHRTDNAISFKGMGVGMSIVKRIMDRIGGSIRYESAIGEGTTFILTFKKPS